jgi:O-antigen/teichoic acid export membrane protein
MRESLTRRYTARLAGGLIGLPLGVVLQAVTSRSLGPANLGAYGYLVGFFTDIIGFADSGLGIAHYRKMCAEPDRQAEWMAFFWRVVGGLLALLSLAVLLVWIADFQQLVWPGHTILFVWLGLGVAAATWIVSLIGKAADAWGYTRITEISRVWNRLGLLGVVVLIASLGWLSLPEYFLAQLTSLLLLALVWAVQLRRRGREALMLPRRASHPGDKVYLRELWKFTQPLWLYSLVGMLVGQFDRWILLRSAGDVEFGYYSAGLQIGALCFAFASALTQLLIGEYTRAVAENNLERLRVLFVRSVGGLYVVSAYLGIFCAVNAEVVTVCYGGEKFRAGAFTVAALCLYPLHQTYGQLSGSLFLARGETRAYATLGNTSALLGVGITTVCVLPAFLNWGSFGLAVKMVLTQLFLANLQLYHNSRLLGLSFGGLLLQQVGVALAFGLAAVFVKFSVNAVGVSGIWPTLIISGTLYTIVAATLVLMMDLAGLRTWLQGRIGIYFNSKPS